MECPVCKSKELIMVNDVSKWLSVYVCTNCGVLKSHTLNDIRSDTDKKKVHKNISALTDNIG